MIRRPALSDRFHRREFLAASAVAAAGLVLPATARGRPAHSARGNDGPASPARLARNCIFMVSDGMSAGTLSLAHLWLKRRAQRESQWIGLWSRPGVRRAAQATHCADSLVTDSAAAGSAWGCGLHVNLGAINVDPGGRQLLPVFVQALQAGKRTGVVSTARLTHATPASFFANAPRRDLEGLIAEQMLDRGLEVMLGGGERHFPADLLSRHAGVAIVRDAAGLEAAPSGQRLLGLFAPSHMPFVIERPASVPSLAAMTNKALATLSRPGDSTGFLLQIEGGRVDHAAHNNDAAALVREQAEFDDAIGAVMEFLAHRDDTLLVVTTDHGNANPGLTLYGKAAEDGLNRLASAKHSFDWIDDRAAEHTDARSPRARAERMIPLIEEATGVSLSPEDKRMFAGAVEQSRVAPFAAANKWPCVLGALLADHFAVAFASPNHTADLTEVTAIGPGAELIPPHIDNIDLHAVMVAALGLPEGKPLPEMDEPMRTVITPKPD